MRIKPLMLDSPPYLQFLALLTIVISSLLFSTLLGLLIAVPVYGLDIALNLTKTIDYSNPEVVSFMKFMQVINQIGFFVIPSLIFAWLVSPRAFNYLKMSRVPGFLWLLPALMMIIVSIPFINWLVALNEGMNLPESMNGIERWMRNSEDSANRLTEAFMNVVTVKGLIVNLIVIALLAGIGEELLFRGVLLRLLIDWTRNIHAAVIISSFIFSALHLQFYGFIPRLVLGLIFGYLFVWTNSLWIPVILHFIFNASAVVVAYLFNRGVIDIDVESFGTTSNMVYVVLSILLTVFFLGMIYLQYRKRKSHQQDNYQI